MYENVGKFLVRKGTNHYEGKVFQKLIKKTKIKNKLMIVAYHGYIFNIKVKVGPDGATLLIGTRDSVR